MWHVFSCKALNLILFFFTNCRQCRPHRRKSVNRQLICMFSELTCIQLSNYHAGKLNYVQTDLSIDDGDKKNQTPATEEVK